MARLKSWESPRRQGRNDKSKQASARLRQMKKARNRLSAKLKQGSGPAIFVQAIDKAA